MSNLKINRNLVNDYKTSFDSAKASFNSESYSSFKNSYLATCSDSTVREMYNNLNTYYSNIDNGYNSIDNYWTKYNEDSLSLEESLSSNNNVCTNPNVSSHLSKYVESLPETKSPSLTNLISKINGVDNSGSTKMTPISTSTDYKMDRDLTYKPGEDSNNKVLLNEETGYDDKIIDYGMTAEELEENLNSNLNDLELLYAEKTKELHELEEKANKIIDYDPRSKSSGESEELRNQIAEKKEELAAIKNQIQQTENQINLIPYYNLVYNDDYDEVLSTIDTEDIANYSMEELQSDYGVTKGAKGYNTLVDPLLVAESVKEHFPNKSDEELAYDYSILNISDESFTEMTYLDVYNYTTPEQRNIYHYLWKTQGREAADEYLLLLLDNINQSKGYYQAMQYISTLDLNDKGELETSLANYFGVSVKGLGDGIDTFCDGITENLLDDGTFTADEYEKMYVLYYLSENSNYYDEVYGFHSSVGNMLPAIAISMATSFVGTTFGVSTITIGGEEIALGELAGSTALGLSSYGNAKHEALHNGVSVYEANVYAICIGMSETLLDYKLGNIKWISKSSSMKFFDLAKEGFTEAAQEYIQQGLDYGLLGKDIDLSTMTADAGKSFLFGVLLSCYFNGSGKAFTVTYNGIKYTIDPKTSIEYFNENKDASLDIILNESSVGNEKAESIGNNAPKYNQGISNNLSTPEYYDVDLSFLDSAPAVKEIVEEWFSKIKIDYRVGVELNETIADENYVYGVHRTSEEYMANSIYEEGLQYTGDSGSGDLNYKNNIDFSNNVRWQINSNKKMQDTNIFENVADNYKSDKSKHGYGMVIKIPKEYVLGYDSYGNPILDLDKVTYEKNGEVFLKPEFVVGEVETDNNHMLDSKNTRFKSNSKSETNNLSSNAPKYNQGISSANTNTEEVGPLNTKFYNKETISNMYENNPNSLTVLFTMNGISDAEIMQIFNTYDKDTIVAALCETDEAKRNNNIKTLKINLNSKSDVNSFLQAKFTTSETNTFNKSNTNISNNKDYYDLKIDGLDKNPVLKEYANDYKQETKIDKNTGESIEKIISDDNYVYGVHRTPFVLWANDIYQNGIMLTGDSSSGAFKNTIDLEDNISFEKSKNEYYNNFMIYRDLSSSSYYKSFEEGSGYGMLVKIPKEYTTINEQGEITYDLEKLTYEKDGITYLKPEFIVGQVEAENGNLVDKGNTRFKE